MIYDFIGLGGNTPPLTRFIERDQYHPDHWRFPFHIWIQMALSYVASHLANVDSLLGFPDEVGRQLFDEAHRLGHFRQPISCVEPFRLFSEAYGAAFVSTLSLSKITISSFVCEIITKSCGSVLEEVHLKGIFRVILFSMITYHYYWVRLVKCLKIAH